MLKLLTLSTRPSFTELKLFRSSVRGTVVQSKLSLVQCSLACVGILYSSSLSEELGGRIVREFATRMGYFVGRQLLYSSAWGRS